MKMAIRIVTLPFMFLFAMVWGLTWIFTAGLGKIIEAWE